MLKHLVLFIFISFSANVFASLNSVLDSTGIEKKGGKTYIVHKVEPKETLYAISKKYGVSIEDIKKANEDLTKDLQVGQKILVPAKNVSTAIVRPSNFKTHSVQAKETLYSISRTYGVTVDDLKKANPGVDVNDMKIGDTIIIPSGGTASTTVTPSALPKNHTVQPKETFYSISKKYGMTVEALKKANPGTGELQVGQVLNISSKGTVAVVTDKKPDPVKTPVDTKNNPVQPVVTVRPETNLPEIKKDGYTKVNESGFVEVYEAGGDFHYALHKSAPIGTIVYLENPDSGQKVYVRVMGKLTDTTPGVIMKVSKKAFEKISKGDQKVKVSSSYIP